MPEVQYPLGPQAPRPKEVPPQVEVVVEQAARTGPDFKGWLVLAAALAAGVILAVLISLWCLRDGKPQASTVIEYEPLESVSEESAGAGQRYGGVLRRAREWRSRR